VWPLNAGAARQRKEAGGDARRVARMGGAQTAVSTEERGGKFPGAARRWDESGRAGTRVHGSGRAGGEKMGQSGRPAVT